VPPLRLRLAASLSRLALFVPVLSRRNTPPTVVVEEAKPVVVVTTCVPAGSQPGSQY